jgi:biotin transport system substrate-specific component
MTTLSVSSRASWITVAGIIGFAAALAAASQVAIPIPGTPVPITLQPFIVVLAGLWLGPAAGAASMALYLVMGALGLPVFAPIGAPGIARFVGPTGGYLFAYPVAAFVAGAIAARRDNLAWRWLAACSGIAMLFVGGIAQLTLLTGSFSRAVALGVTPFAALDVVKAFIAALISGRRAGPRGT